MVEPSTHTGLPPNGWSLRIDRERTVITGWDWMLGAMSLGHGLLTLGPAVWWTGSFARGFGLWLAVSLSAAAGVGWRLVIDARGFAFSRTWWGIPFSRRRHAVGSAVVVADDPWTPDGADWSEWVLLGEGASRQSEFGSARNAAPIVRAIAQAVARHHGPRRSGTNAGPAASTGPGGDAGR